ncbi:MAG: hypothetical protein GEV28_18250 [Actinophytocola sp.]|uniref:hypothetical protein n=1 Tax=Actinophytocola sp. TaxID=1872138 RepID=UPI001328D4DF|nr:hypothetical protein [Actinophytocola sp.]MPZ82228.1 hypothetical protein [Actinophytocola sp.]
MPSIEEMDAEIAHMEAANKKVRDELLAEYRAELEAEKDPFQREWLRKRIEGVLEIGGGKYDDDQCDG